MPDHLSPISISRPRFWLYLAGPFAIGVLAAAPAFSALIRLDLLLFFFYFLFPANLLIYGVNDIFDFETDRLNPKKQGYETAVSPEVHRRLSFAILLANLPFLFFLPLIPRGAIIAFLLFLFLGVFYSAPPIRAKARPFLDSLFNILYFMPGVFGWLLLTPRLPPLSLLVAAGLWCVAMHAFSAVPDITADRDAKLSTIATTLGARGTILLCLTCYAGSALLLGFHLPVLALPLGAVYSALMLFALFSPSSLFRIYTLFPFVNIASGALLTFAVLARFF